MEIYILKASPGYFFDSFKLYCYNLKQGAIIHYVEGALVLKP